MRSATTSGCSTKLVVESITPGIRTLSGGSFTSRQTRHSFSWRAVVPAHGEVRTIELEDESGVDDGAILIAHHVGDGLQVGLVAGVVVIGEEDRDDAGRGRGHEQLFGT